MKVFIAMMDKVQANKSADFVFMGTKGDPIKENFLLLD